MKVWQTIVLVETQNGYQPVARPMETQAPSYQTARAYFEKFGKVISTIRIKNS